MNKSVILEIEGKIATITINRPKVNALNTQVLRELDEVIDDISNDENIYVVIITGAGEKSFVAGADITEMKDMTTIEGRRFSQLGNKVFRKIETMEKPVIAALNGFTLGGGCELAMCCDLRIASTKAIFAQPEVGLGITPGFGGTQRLVRLVGLGTAKELIFTGKSIDAVEAMRVGLVNKVVESEKLMEETKQLATVIASQAPVAVRLAKAAINTGIQCDLETALRYEAEVFGECFSTEDQKEGMNAFIERREKSFKNN